jgi:uncharacterized protein (TIGR03435 family)
VDQIQGPQWLYIVAGQPYYNVDAILPAGSTKEQFRQMLQNLLVERFHLAFRRETRNFPGYALVVDKGGPKFKEATPEENGVEVTAQAMGRAPKGADGFPVIHAPFTMSQLGQFGNIRVKYQQRSMAEFAGSLGSRIGSALGKGAFDGHLQPRVADKTDLTGTYTFTLEYYDASLDRSSPRRLPDDGSGASASDLSEPARAADLFIAIRNQLGLRLEKSADVPVDVIVIESVDKSPTAN